MMKGKDIKVPFDCLWHHYTRKFEAITFHKGSVNNDGYYCEGSKNSYPVRPEGFEDW
jgi:hypothetical protein